MTWGAPEPRRQQPLIGSLWGPSGRGVGRHTAPSLSVHTRATGNSHNGDVPPARGSHRGSQSSLAVPLAKIFSHDLPPCDYIPSAVEPPAQFSV